MLLLLLQLLDVVVKRNNDEVVYLVFPYYPIKLAYVHFESMAAIKCCVHQLLTCMAALHSHEVLHRDLKVQNMMYSLQGELKVIDFGMANVVAHARTTQVITRMYRPPELLFGCTAYTSAIDMWSVGCIMAELVLGQPYLPGNTDIEQLSLIFRALGTPEQNAWQSAKDLPAYIAFQPAAAGAAARPLDEQFPTLNGTGIDLLRQFLRLDPDTRISAADALEHPFFTTPPLPCAPTELTWTVPQEQHRQHQQGGRRVLF